MKNNKWVYVTNKEKEDPYEKIIPQLQDISVDFNLKTPEEQDIVVDKIFKLIREINVFPIIYYNKEGIHKEIQSVLNKKNICIIDHTIQTQLRNGLLLLDFLFPNLHLATTCNEDKNMYERFYDDDILKFCIKRYLTSGYLINNLRTLFFSTARLYWDTPINFSPMRAKIIYEHFCPTGGTIYDYSSGYGGRMLGALGSDKKFKYIATEPNTLTYNNLLQLGEYIEEVTKRKNSYQIYNLCSEQLQLKPKSIDFAFSCPPFFNKEIYTDEPTQSISKFPNYKEWLEKYVRPTIKNCYLALKDNGVFCFDVINYYFSGKKIPLVEDWTRIAEEEGFYFKDKIPIKSKMRKTTEDSEYIYLFMKSQDSELPNYTTYDLMSEATIAKQNREERQYRRTHVTIAEYNIFGQLEKTYKSYDEINIEKEILKSKKLYNNKYYRIYWGDDTILAQLQVKQPIAQIKDNYFFSYSDLARYLGVSRQAVQQAYKRQSTSIAGKSIIWLGEK